MRVHASVEVDAQRVRCSVISVTELLRGTGGAIGAQIVVLEEIETIERSRAAPHVPVHTLIRVKLVVGLREGRVQPTKRVAKRLGRSEILLRAFGVSEPEDFVLDDRPSRICAKLFPLKRRRRGIRQGRRTLIAAVHPKHRSVYLIASGPGYNIHRTRGGQSR